MYPEVIELEQVELTRWQQASVTCGCEVRMILVGSMGAGSRGCDASVVLWTRANMHLVLGRFVISVVASGLVSSWVLNKHVKSGDVVVAQVGPGCTRRRW